MATIQHGTVTVSFDDFLTPPAIAGKMSAEALRRIARPPKGVGYACLAAADTAEKADGKFVMPAGVDPQTLREAGRRADEIDLVIADLEVVLGILKQANAIFDGEAWEKLRMVNDQVKAQAKYHPEIEHLFRPVLDFFARGPRRATAPDPVEPTQP